MIRPAGVKIVAYIVAVALTFFAIRFFTTVEMDLVALVVCIGILYSIPFLVIGLLMDRHRDTVRPHRARASRKL